MQELWFLRSARRLMLIDIYMKFHEDSLKGFSGWSPAPLMKAEIPPLKFSPLLASAFVRHQSETPLASRGHTTFSKPAMALLCEIDCGHLIS